MCGRAFSWKKSLVRHKRTHSAYQPVSCDVRNKTFIS
jgi:hypothetical protein